MLAPMESASQRSTYWTVITAEDASRIIEQELFDHQRRVRPGHVEKIARMMMLGDFEASEIKFAVTPDGRRFLINGQHRLHAIKSSGLSQTMNVTLVPAADMARVATLYAAEDRGAPRTLLDTYGALGLHEELGLLPDTVRRASSAIGVIASGFDVGRYTRSRLSDADRVRLIREWTPQLELWENARNFSSGELGTTKRMSVAAAMAVALVTLRFQPAKASGFWRDVARNDALSLGTPERTLADYLTIKMPVRGGGQAIFSAARYIASSWNAFFEGRALSISRATSLGAPILLLGTPYNGKKLISLDEPTSA